MDGSGFARMWDDHLGQRGGEGRALHVAAIVLGHDAVHSHRGLPGPRLPLAIQPRLLARVSIPWALCLDRADTRF